MPDNEQPESESAQSATSLNAGHAVLAIVLSSALFGILTRPHGFLAAFWPANPILLGMMVRWPKFNCLSGWIAAVLGYVLADVLTGNEVLNTLWLTSANVAGAAVGTTLFGLLSTEHRRLLAPTSMLYLLGITTVISITSSLIGASNTMVVQEHSWMRGFSFWFVGEFVNHLLLLSVMLATPTLPMLKEEAIGIYKFHRKAISNLLPVASLIASVFLATQIGGPGAIAFVVPSLMWCSIVYQRFTTSLMTLVTLVSILIADSAGLIHLAPTGQYTVDHTMSLRLGVALLSLVPVMSSSIYEARQKLIEQLSHSLQYDSLTEALARNHFLQNASQIACRSVEKDRDERAYCLMLDIDYFKLINDTFGHAAGDQVLRVFSNTVKSQLRRGDLFGRLGGEEFSVILSNTTATEAYKIAERIRQQVELTNVQIADGRVVTMTVSIGIASLQSSLTPDLEQILIQADRALYSAKENGRNQVHLASSDEFVCLLEPA